MVEHEQGTLREAGRMTVAEYLERWLEDARARLAPRTFERYSQIVRLRAVPALGHIHLDKLRPLHLQEFYRSLADGEGKDVAAAGSRQPRCSTITGSSTGPWSRP